MRTALKKWKHEDDKWVKGVGDPHFAQNVKSLSNGFAFTTSTRSVSAKNRKTQRYHLVYNKKNDMGYSKTASGAVRNQWSKKKFMSLHR